MSCKQIEQFGKFESRIFRREIKNIKTWFFDRTALIRQGSGPNIQRDRLLRKGLLPIYFLKIANGKKDLMTKKVGYSWIGSSCNFYLHVFEQNNWNFLDEHLRIWEDGLVDRAAFSEQRLRQNFSSAKCTHSLVPHFLLPTIPHR